MKYANAETCPACGAKPWKPCKVRGSAKLSVSVHRSRLEEMQADRL